MEQSIFQSATSTTLNGGVDHFQNRPLFLAKRQLAEHLSHSRFFDSWQFPNHFNFNYFGVNIGLHFSDERMVESIVRHFSRFASPGFNQHSVVDLHLNIVAPSSFALFPRDWEEEPSSDIYCGNNETGVFAIQRDFVALKCGQISNAILATWEPHQPDGAMNFLRWALPWAMLPLDRALLHSSAFLDHHNNAHVILGVSGAGKTTLATKAMPRPVIGDDMNVISFDREGCKIAVSSLGGAFPTLPFSQTLFPISAFYLPQKLTHGLELKKITSARLLRVLMGSIANCSWPYLPQNISTKLLAIVATSIQSIPAYELGFSLDQEVWHDIIPNA